MASSSALLFFSALLFAAATTSNARDLLVGGRANAWSVPSPASPTLNQWAGSTRFQAGDSLVWKMEGRNDSVLRVSRKDYLSCNTSTPIEEHREKAEVVVRMERPGAYYFISGEEVACEKGEKMAVVVMAERSAGGRNYGFFARGGPAPAPGPVGSEAEESPALAPTSGGARNGVVVVRDVAAVVVGVGMLVLL